MKPPEPPKPPPLPPPQRLTLLDRALAFTGPHEGTFRKMYKDSKGKVTVGVGFMLPFVETALLLPFQPRETVASDYQTVRMLPVGHTADWYQSYTRSELSPESIRTLFVQKCGEFITSLQRAFPGMQHFPEPASLALIDMAYNMGPHELLSWPKLVTAVRSLDWKTCAAQCHRKDVGDARNEATAALFREAASRAA